MRISALVKINLKININQRILISLEFQWTDLYINIIKCHKQNCPPIRTS